MKKMTLSLLGLSIFTSLVLIGCGSSTSVSESTITGSKTTDIQSGSTTTIDTIAYQQDHEELSDYSWNSSSIVSISLSSNAISIDGSGATADGSILTISSAGTYTISGSLSNGQIIVDTADDELVQIILDGVDITNATSSPIYVKSAEKTVLILAENSVNYITDSSSYVYEDSEEDEPDAAIFSKDDLSISGDGKLIIDANYNDAIKSKDGLIIVGGEITIDSIDDGIIGKDYLVIKGGVFDITAGGDSLKSTNDSDAEKGYISIENGTFNIVSENDSIQASTNIKISGGDFTLESGGGSSVSLSSDISAKGIKATSNIVIDSGVFSINSADDALHANEGIVINGGTFNLSTGDDGIHADSTLTINNGTINIIKSYEGLESAVITINSGDINIVSSDDGVNVAGGIDSSGFGGRPQGGGPTSQENFSYSGDYYLYINGGRIVVDANGDGIDVNGAIEMSDGIVIVNGPTSNGNGALDYDATFQMSGGFLVATGSSGMAQAPSTSSTQNSLLVSFSSAFSSDTMIHLETNTGEEIFTFAPTKAYQSLVFSSMALNIGTTYNLYSGGSSTGMQTDGLYEEDASYSAGNKYTSFTVSSVITTIGGGR